ncbi:cyclodehydratase [[Mycobacterium] wendilense]|uniref:Cyclodehydratase n=1 Tax=[Mycobacterium] wendilense TaxID=3064284 RepID=A0ABM9MGQ4_9MYCO|nr:cyclodehydratase [Mycolicibacterium sp. MU0050]CAJ1584677.1 cyclodehydratase [Mycolicibacterium sp. MU0050]
MTQLFSLDPAMPVLLRPDGVVQIGWDPRRAVLVRPPGGLTAAALAGVLQTMRTSTDLDRLYRDAARHGPVDAAEFAALVTALVTAGVARPGASARPSRSTAIRVHGKGPLTDRLVEGLGGTGVRVSHSSQPHAVMRSERTDLVVLSDYLVADPRVVRELHSGAVPHLQVRVRDGTGLVGPLVIPGVTSCLMCADLHRSDRDAAWPVLAAQLRDTVGVADHCTVLATAALALGQVRAVLSGVRAAGSRAPAPAAPQTLSTTLEFDVGAGSIVTRRWPRHPRCPC